MISAKFFILPFSLLLSSVAIQAAFIAPQQSQYDLYCGPNPSTNIGAMCFDLKYDIREHMTASSAGVVGMLDEKNHDLFALPVGDSRANANTPMWFETLQHRVNMIAIKICVSYWISVLKTGATERNGVYCPSDPHLTF
ncbi:uncharacterized protein SRS1_25006 [Sporisorium reilianum f. sp. reilianum]|uniref:Mig1 protein n=1 Tax=Sporisorium reilianum f. sp. reilianum TaxID=72559 RepID=A0A2N8UIK0_9BASI|nr:uncharacterized protein SRS1_25006 [Sporisorium reilianum f. sp. reilianum]